jgi:hypothetical protein
LVKVGRLVVVAFVPEEEPVVAAACIVAAAAADLTYLVEEAFPVEHAFLAASYLVAVAAVVDRLVAQAYPPFQELPFVLQLE